MAQVFRNVIYGLIDPNTNELRYVGYARNLQKRIMKHHSPSNLKKNTHKNAWIKSLLAKKQKADVWIIEQYETSEELPQAEIEIIAYFKYIGCNLTNGTLGGDGGMGRKHTDEELKKMSDAKIGKPASQYQIDAIRKTKANKPAWNRNVSTSQEIRQKQSAAAIKHRGRSAEDIKIIINMRENNIAYKQIAKIMHISTATIAKICKGII